MHSLIYTLIALLVTAVVAPKAQAQEVLPIPVEWNVDIEVDVMGEWENSLIGNQFFQMVCSDNGVSGARIFWVDVSGYQKSLRMRVDEEPVMHVEVQHDFFDQGVSRFVSYSQAQSEVLIAGMRRGNTLLVEFNTINGYQIMEIDLTGFDAAYRQAKHCK